MFYLPGVCIQTDTKGKQRKARVRNILKSLDKNTIFNEHPVPSFNTSSLLNSSIVEMAEIVPKYLIAILLPSS